MLEGPFVGRLTRAWRSALVSETAVLARGAAGETKPEAEPRSASDVMNFMAERGRDLGEGSVERSESVQDDGRIRLTEKTRNETLQAQSTRARGSSTTRPLEQAPCALG